MSSETENRKISDLRVVDLRVELEKRGLDKAGNKQVLLERLQKALQDEGLDHQTYQFDGEKKFSKRLSTSSSCNDSTAKDPNDESEDILDTSNNEIIDVLEEESTIESNQEKVSSDNNIEKMSAETSINIANDSLESVKKSSNEETEVRPILDNKKRDSIDTKMTVKDDNLPIEFESPIRLTLEEEEAFQDEEDTLNDNKSELKSQKPENEDMKNTTNKNQDSAAKDIQPVNSDKQLDNKKQDGSTTSSGVSNSKLPSKSKKMACLNRNLWITNISQTTRATELKQALSFYGKVIGAKVVINAKYPGACCYGYVTMDTVEDADKCIAKLNNTELNGQIIRIEKVRPDHMNSMKTPQKMKPSDPSKDDKFKSKTTAHKPSLPDQKTQEQRQDAKKEVPKEGEKEKDKTELKKDGKDDGHKSDSSSKRPNSNRRSRSFERSSEHSRRRSNSKGGKLRPHDRDVLTFDKIKEERERQRLRERERIVREESRRRHEEAVRQREIERLQRSEAARLDREREKLRLEREKLEREKAELIRLERERQKLEREKLELEKLELQHVKMRLQEEDRRAVKRSAPYRRESSYEDRKRLANDRRYAESPPPPRFDPSSVKAHEPTPPSKKFGSTAKEYKSRVSYDKRDSYGSKRDREYEAERGHPQSSLSRGPPTSITKYEGSSVFNISRERDIRDGRPRESTSSMSNTRMSKESRYNERDRERSPPYRHLRDDRGDRRPIPDHKGEVRTRDHRYVDPSKDSQRFERNTSSNNWSHPSASNKVFNAGGPGGPQKTWSKDSWRPVDSSNNPDRWNSGTVSRGASSLSTTAFSGSSSISLGPPCPPPPAINNYSGERFEYKSMGNLRKY